MGEKKNIRLYVVRHGKAVAESEDPQRPLTATGRQETQKIAAFLAKDNVTVSSIIHSTKLRAKQTAAILAEAVGHGCPVIEQKGLSPNDPIEPILRQITQIKDSMMLVGHLPFVEHLVAMLLAGDETPKPVRFHESSVAVLEKKDTAWQLTAFLTPVLIPYG